MAQAAAQNLTPTTLELGGKSPCIIDGHCDMKDAALKIAHGKLLNAGQTCIAPDYVPLPRGREGEFAQAYAAAVARLFPTIEGNGDYASIITARHHARLRTMLQQAQTQGAEVQTIDPTAGKPVVHTTGTLGDGVSRQMLPTLVFGATSAMQLMQEEILAPSCRWSRTSGWTMPSPTSTQGRARWRCTGLGRARRCVTTCCSAP